jgi:hypothetical protein
MTSRTAVLLSAMGLAALSRWLPHPPNVAPVTAMAVFAAARLAGWRLALLAPLAALFVSDLGLEALHHLGLSPVPGLYGGMGWVYAATACAALPGFLVRRTRSPVAVAAALLAGSCVFFLVSNFGVWTAGVLYPRDPGGLVLCYEAALPFFRNALLGDAVYGALLFGGLALAEARFPAVRPA